MKQFGMKTVLITGCSSGFGKEAVNQFLAQGWQVIATLRDAENRTGLFKEEISRYGNLLHLLPLDVTVPEQIQAVKDFIAFRLNSRLDCLINNAGYGLFGALEDIEKNQFRNQMEVNFFGVVFLTQALLPFLRNAKGRVVNISSVLGYVGMPLTSAYCASKFAVEGLTEALYYELEPYGVQVALVEPGGHRTRFGESVVWGIRSFRQESPYWAGSQKYEKFRQQLSTRPNPVNATHVARVLIRLAEQKKMPLRVKCGNDAWATFILKKLLSEFLNTRLFSKVYRKAYYAPFSTH
jgi:NAD(P)-dependent dehydrogenase (short-subunit alcohol dehydrogenase family)